MKVALRKKIKLFKTPNLLQFCAIAVLLLGVWNLFVGRMLKARIESFFVPRNLPMADDAALCFIFCGGSLLLFLHHKKRSALSLSALCLITSCFALVSKFYGDSSVNDFLFGIPVGMSTHTAICFILFSMALIFLALNRFSYFAQYLFHIITLTCFVVLLGHIFNVAQFYHFTFISAMSIYTAIGFLLVSVAASLLQPNVGLAGLFTGKMIGNVMARTIFFQLVFIIVALGYLRIAAHRYNVIEPELATALVVVVCIILFLYIIEKTTRSLNLLEQKRRRTQENFRLAIESAPYSLVISDKYGHIVMVNACTEKLYGYDRESLIGKKLEMLIPASLHQDYHKKRDSFFADPDPMVMTYRLDDNLFALRKDGTEFPIELVLTPIRAENQILVLACITDMTVRRRHEQLIKEQLMEMQYRNKELEQITAMVSHDLQEPLRTVANYVEMWEEDYSDQFCGETKLHVSSMKATVGRMSLMVRHLLDYSRLGRDRELVLTDCNKVLEAVKDDLYVLLRNSGAEITTQGELPLNYAYETELRQLFQNLIHNAVKFKKSSTPPKIVIDCKAIKGFYEFSVADNGIGIPEKHQQKVFHIFKKLDSGDEGTGIQGHGIGLAFSKKIVEMHGGKIWVESQEGNGTTFKFTIIDFKPSKI